METDENDSLQRTPETEHGHGTTPEEEPATSTVAEAEVLATEPDSVQEETAVPAIPDEQDEQDEPTEQDDTPAEPADVDESPVEEEPRVSASTDSDPDTTLVETPAATEADEEEHTRRLDDHDSLVTVRLSEPPVLTIDTSATEQSEEEPSTPAARTSQKATAMPTLSEADESDDSSDPDVNWEQLQRTEDEESSGKGTENVCCLLFFFFFLDAKHLTQNFLSVAEMAVDAGFADLPQTAMLLARLEQENAKLATNPKSVKVYGPEPQQQQTPRRRPPSMAQLREMVNGPTPPALRYSMLPPPPLTDLEFYAALVQDYQQTAARLPTLLANKIRKGIPPPLRGVVWQGMTDAARDTDLASRFDRFCVATSPYEGIIGKDLGRSFPGVEMFRDPDGDGQRMLGRVLKSYSLHDRRIGYCQGLAFLVGPLLMHMPDKEAFCVLVK